MVLNYDNINYYCRSNFIEEKYIGALICEDEANDVSIYEIENVSTELAIAVKGENKYYPYMNDEYNTSSMEQFFEDIGGDKMIIAPEVRMVVRDNNTESLVYYDGYLEYLKAEINELAKEVKCIELGKAEYTGLHLHFYLEHIKARIDVNFYENGDIHIKCDGVLNSWRFNTCEKGIEFATGLIEYLVENCKGKYY